MWDATAEEAKKGGSAVRPAAAGGPQPGDIARLEQGLPGLRLESGGRGGMLAAWAPDAWPWRGSALHATGNTTASAVWALVVPSRTANPDSCGMACAFRAFPVPVRSSACLNTTLPGIRGDRLAPEAVLGVTVHAGGHAWAGRAGSAALLP